MLATACLCAGAARAQSVPTAATSADSGWVDLFNGTTLGDEYFVYKGGYQAMSAQNSFKVENGMIHAGGSYALLVTQKEYGYYRLRVEYRFGENVGSGANAGMMIALNTAGAKTDGKPLRPRSIEINCRRDTGYPWTLWASQDLGPMMQTTVQKGTPKYLSRAEGGVDYVVDPSGNRTLESAYPNPELPPGQWNRGLAEVYGDSGNFTLNGKPRTAGWHWTEKVGGKELRVARGAVGVQTEGSDIWYRAWQIQELDSATRVPIHARRGCTDASKPKYDPRAVVNDGSCTGTGIATLRPRNSPVVKATAGKAKSIELTHWDVVGRNRHPFLRVDQLFRKPGS